MFFGYVKKVFFFFLLPGCQEWGFRTQTCIFGFCLLYDKMLEKDKQKKGQRQRKDYKSSVFKVVLQKWEKWKNGFLAKIACQEGRKTCIFMHTICFGQNFGGPKQLKTRKHYKNSGFSGNCPKPKMTPNLFSWKRLFLGWVKKCFFY